MNQKIIFTTVVVLVLAVALAVLGLTRLTNSAPIEKTAFNNVPIKEKTLDRHEQTGLTVVSTPEIPQPVKQAEFVPVNSGTVIPAGNQATPANEAVPQKKTTAFPDEVFNGEKIVKSEAEWRRQLTAEQFYVLRRKGTEKPETGKYTHNKQEGIYYCAACGLALFSSKAKFDSETGWASFYKPFAMQNVMEEIDNTQEETRTEVLCVRCHSHLGHVFDDGPEPTGLRYCINSVSLNFKKQKVR